MSRNTLISRNTLKSKSGFVVKTNPRFRESRTNTCLVYLVHGNSLIDLFENNLISLCKIKCTLDVRVYTSIETYPYIQKLREKLNLKFKIFLIVGFSTDDYTDYDSKEFSVSTSKKWSIILDSLSVGYNTVIFSDCDIVFLRNFESYIDYASKIYSCGCQSESGQPCDWTYCTGFMFYTQAATSFIKAMDEFNKQVLRSVEGRNDQDCFNYYVKENMLYKDILALPEALFQNGMHYRSHQGSSLSYVVRELNPYLFHANFTLGLDNKVNLLKDVSLWYL